MVVEVVVLGEEEDLEVEVVLVLVEDLVRVVELVVVQEGELEVAVVQEEEVEVAVAVEKVVA